MIKVFQTSLSGVLEIQREKPFKDCRGMNVDVYAEQEYFDAGIRIKFVQQNYSTSGRGVLRGLHGDDHTFKLVCCVSGSFLLAVINYDNGSPDFGRWLTFILTEDDGRQILIPPNYLNGHLVLSEKATFFYNQSSYYTGAGNQWSVRWNDPRFNIPWPIIDPILSARDAGV